MVTDSYMWKVKFSLMTPLRHMKEYWYNSTHSCAQYEIEVSHRLCKAPVLTTDYTVKRYCIPSDYDKFLQENKILKLQTQAIYSCHLLLQQLCLIANNTCHVPAELL